MRDQLKEMFDNNLNDESYEEERRRKEASRVKERSLKPKRSS